MADEEQHAAKVGGDGDDNADSADRIRIERRIFAEYALNHESLRDFFESIARDYLSLTSDQRGELLLSIANTLAELRDETEVTRSYIRELALEYLKGSR